MNKLFSLLVSVLTTSTLFANINFVVDYAVFQNPNENSYIEFYLSINGASILYAQKENLLFQSNIEVTYLIEDGDKVISFEKFQLNSPEYEEQSAKLDLMNLKRMSIPAGEYRYSVIIKDLVAKTQGEINNQPISIDPLSKELNISELQIGNQISPTTEKNDFSKNGYDITPSVSHNFNEKNGVNELVAYLEIYNAEKSLGIDEAYLLDISVLNKATQQVVENLRAIKRMKAAEVTPYIQSFNLETLPTGDYIVQALVKNKKNEILAKSETSIFRLNTAIKDLSALGIEGSFVDSIRDTKQLAEYIKCLRPTSNATEKVWADNQLRYAELDFMQRYFLNFWKVRNDLDPYRAWQDYKYQVKIADQKFGYGGVKGYTTERGRVYLQYGPPDVVQDAPFDGETYPYSIWQYYKLNNLVNQRFVFYSVTSGMLGYQVLHSTYPGENKNEDWQNSLSSKSVRPGSELNKSDGIHKNVQDLFDNPR
ncbi:MAG: GWxTD domain-containing protein [Flavobacteriales bacterium]|nr:GWxTD domain-containing protein [Flavobacteriales bacterium]